MLITTLSAAALIWLYFDRKDAKKSQEIIERENQGSIIGYCLIVINSCKTREQLLSANRLVRNCTNKNYIDLNDYHILIKRIWSKHNAIH